MKDSPHCSMLYLGVADGITCYLVRPQSGDQSVLLLQDSSEDVNQSIFMSCSQLAEDQADDFVGLRVSNEFKVALSFTASTMDVLGLW